MRDLIALYPSMLWYLVGWYTLCVHLLVVPLRLLEVGGIVLSLLVRIGWRLLVLHIGLMLLVLDVVRMLVLLLVHNLRIGILLRIYLIRVLTRYHVGLLLILRLLVEIVLRDCVRVRRVDFICVQIRETIL